MARHYQAHQLPSITMSRRWAGAQANRAPKLRSQFRCGLTRCAKIHDGSQTQLVFQVGSALSSSNNFTISAEPYCAAIIKAMVPLGEAASI